MGNLIGEPFDAYVNNQIDARQQIYGKKVNRTTEEIAYLNSNNGWAKLASGVSIDKDRLALLKKNNNQMLNNVSTGKQLAMEYVLFNSITSYSESTDEDGNKKYSQNQYQGVGKGGRVAYGIDGTDFGYSPMPGLIDVDIKDLNRGSIKKATLTIKVFNRNQLEVIDCLYMRLGYTVLLEWGHSKYWDDVQKQLINQPASLIDTSFFNDEFNNSDYTKFIPLIKEHRKKTRGNYDAMFGTVSNFSWTFESDGSYNCKIEIISLGDIVESLGISVSTGDSDNDRIAQIKLANSNFSKEPVDITNFYTNLYPGLETSLRDYYDKNVSILLNSDYSILRANYGIPGRTAEITSPEVGNIGFVYTPANPVDLTDENKEFLELKEKNVAKYFGSVSSVTNVAKTSNSVIASFYIRALKWYFNKMKEGGEYLKVVFDDDQNIIGFNKIKADPKEGEFRPYNWKNRQAGASKVGTVEFNYISGSRTLTADEAEAEGLIEDQDYLDDGYNPNNLSGTLVFKGYLGSNDPDGDLLSRKPLGFVNLAIVNRSKKDIVERDNESYFFTNIQKQILLKIIDFELFKKYIYNGIDDSGKDWRGFVGKDLAGGENDPQFKEQKEAQEAEEQEEEKGKKELMEFERIASEKSLRGNIFKYFYTIKKFYEPKAVPSDEAKNKVIFEFSAEADLVSFPSLETRPPINMNFGDSETLKVGNIINPYKSSDIELVEKWNKDVSYPIYNKINEDTGYFPFNNKGEKLSSSWTDFVRLNATNVDLSFYIQFGTLLSYLRDVCITSIDTEGAPPVIGIDTSELENVCYAIDTQYSLDPKKLIIRNDNFYVSEDINGKIYEGLRNFVVVTPEGTYGNLMNVYLNFNRIEELLTKLVDKRGEVKLFDFVESICEDINDCLGGVNNIEVTVNKDNNKLVIRDQTPIPNSKNIFPNKFAAIDQQVPLEVFGYTDNKASFVHNIGFTTKISKEYATMITVGATSKGSVPGTEATAFSKWNLGIEDRFKNNLTSPDSVNSEKTNPLEKLSEENKKTITSYTSNSLLGVQNQGFNSVKYGENTYLTFNDEFIKNNSKIVKEFLKYEQAYVTLDESPENKGIIESSIGFIPFNLSIDMEGMSGFKIYNRLKVNTNFLPSNYDETLDFIVTGVNHKISNNQWKTSLATLATSKSVLTK